MLMTVDSRLNLVSKRDQFPVGVPSAASMKSVSSACGLHRASSTHRADSPYVARHLVEGNFGTCGPFTRPSVFAFALRNGFGRLNSIASQTLTSKVQFKVAVKLVSLQRNEFGLPSLVSPHRIAFRPRYALSRFVGSNRPVLPLKEMTKPEFWASAPTTFAREVSTKKRTRMGDSKREAKDRQPVFLNPKHPPRQVGEFAERVTFRHYFDVTLLRNVQHAVVFPSN